LSKIIFLETTNSSPHLETSLELVKKHLDVGDEVYYYFLGQSISFIDFGIKKSIFKPILCLPEIKAKKILRNPNFHFYCPSKGELFIEIDLPKFKSSEELRRFTYKSYNCGLATLSSLVSKLKESNPDLTKHRILIKEIIESGINIYEYSIKILKAKKPDLVYLFNGRFANNRAILDACIELNISYLIHERGANKYKYSLRNFMPHDFKKARNEIFEFTKRVNFDDLEKTGSKFFLDRRNGVEQSWISFTKNQIKGKTAEFFENKEKRIITYFSSSEDEYVAVGDIVKWDRWPNQYSAIKDLISIISENKSLFLFIRLHPHLALKSKDELKFWVDLTIPDNVRIIFPDEPIDSYAQIEISSAVVTCGSTVGIESVFWGKPSICLGPSLYEDLGAVYLPADKNELKEMLLDKSLKADSRKALPFGYYMSLFGEKFVYYKPETLFSGEFMGVNLQSFGICRYLRAAMTFPNRIFRKFTNLFLAPQ
jgi:hypothetical protein